MAGFLMSPSGHVKRKAAMESLDSPRPIHPATQNTNSAQHCLYVKFDISEV